MKESDCMRPCKGDREQACGGSWRIAVYKNPDFKPSQSLTANIFLPIQRNKNNEKND